jgi:hypothetical protein
MDSFGNKPDAAPIATVTPDEDQRRALVQRIVLSQHFSKAHQLRDILLYLAERALADSTGAVHEYEIACVVLGRKANFNPHEDNIVRVQVSHVRKRLDDYFASEGATESVRISIPKGGYTLRFAARPAPPIPIQVRPEALPETRRAIGTRRLLYISGGFLLGASMVIAALAFYGRFYWPAHNLAPKTATVSMADGDLLWPRMFTTQNTSIVVADTCLVMLQDILRTDLSLSEYLNGRFPRNLLDKVPDRSLQAALRLISTRQYTSLADLNSAQQLSELSHRYSPNSPTIRYARHMNVRDFKAGNFILAGSRRGIPWVRLFEPQLNFQMEEDHRTRSYYYRNKFPRLGEPDGWYRESNAETVETYADVAFTPNLGNNGYVLILSGIDMEAAEAAGEFVARPEFQKALTVVLPKIAGRSQLRYFELLLRTRAVAGAASGSQVVSSRILNASIPNP